MCVSHRRHVTSHLKRRGDSQSRADTCAHTRTPLSAELIHKFTISVCVCVCCHVARGIALAKYNIRQQVKSYLIEPKSPARPPRHIALFLPAGTEQDKTAQLNSHFTLSQPAVDCWIPLRHHRSMHTAAACTYCSGNPTLQV